jgi:hypothetical protein
MTSTPTPFIVRITNYLPLIEKILLTALAIGVILIVIKADTTVTKVSLIGLAVTFFLSAYRPIDIPRQENELLGFKELLALMIIPKTMWISCAVSAMGISFYFSQFGNDGYKQMLLIGASTIGMGTIILAFLLMSGVKNLNLVTPILVRAIPLLLVDIYVFSL